ncbi:NAD-dependent epimerase/dehydratase family protein [Luteimonas notoginsengisoli]|uniref:NAD-dependent epimerase/dehydratase family protein n=1 Tax=Luteimonas notoginsengisoli TaxID=1578200 RepID=A0ABV7UP96_9GAMM
MREALVFGGSGQIGHPLLVCLHRRGWRVQAVSRRPQPPLPGVQWLRGDLDSAQGLPPRVDAIFSCGPLDRFARWYAGSAVECPRVVAFGSTSIEVKRDSADAGERDLAARLRAGEAGVLSTAAQRNAAATLLRPTLVYGAGGDRTLTRIAAIAGRWHRFALPRDAVGLRQPAHVGDLAKAAFAVLDAAATHGQAYALPGGETLAYREMVARVLAMLQPPAKLHLLPPTAFRALLSLAHAAGIARDFGDAALGRMRQDLVFDIEPARRDFGYAPRAFEPAAGMFGTG